MNSQQKEGVSQLLWTVFILMFFFIQGVIWTVAISVTSTDVSHAVAEDYDEKSIHWDDVKRRREASARLGWKATLSVDPSSDAYGNRGVTLTLVDSDGQPIENATIQLNAFHRGRAAEKQKLDLEEANGGYSGTVLIQNSGLWQFSGSAVVGEHELLLEERTRLESNRTL